MKNQGQWFVSRQLPEAGTSRPPTTPSRPDPQRFLGSLQGADGDSGIDGGSPDALLLDDGQTRLVIVLTVSTIR